MIDLLTPWALAGAVLLAGPLLVHMLLRRNARRVLFPAVHFLPATRAAAVRFRRPSDLGLLTLRLAIVGAAVAAAAQPVVISSWRRAQWNARTIRAVVVDTAATRSAEGRQLADQQMTAFAAQRFDGSDLRDALARAVVWLDRAPPGRREVVILSDFQHGELDAEDLRVIPKDSGVRLIRAGRPPATREVAFAPVAGFRGGRWQPSVRVDPNGTGVTWTRNGDTAGVPWLTTEQPADEADAAHRAVRAAASFGVAPGDDTRQVRVRFAGAAADTLPRDPVRTRWMLAAALALRDSSLLDEANAAVTSSEQNKQLVLETSVAATSAAAPAVLRAVILAVRPASIADRDAEVLTTADAELAAWQRDSAPVAGPPQNGRGGTVTDSDARWLWLLALALLAVETWARRSRVGTGTVQVRDAA